MLAGSCQTDGTCKISKCFVTDVSPVIASPWGRLFQFIISSLSGFPRGFGTVEHPALEIQLKRIDLQAVFCAVCVFLS